MNSDPAATMDLGGPLSRADSDRKFDRYCAIDREYGFARWAVETSDGEFLGYAGVMPAGRISARSCPTLRRTICVLER